MTFSHPRRLTSPRRLQRSPGSNRILMYPVLLALIIAAGWYYRGHRPQPHMVAKPPIIAVISPTPAPSTPALSQYTLTGARKVTCLRLVIAVDVSGSMADYAEPRDDALNQLFTWLAVGHNLKPNDQVAIIDFAAVAETRMAPTKVADLGTLPGATGAADGVDTLFDPILDQITSFPKTACDTALVLISDAEITDLPLSDTDGQTLLHSDGIDEIRLLVPGAGIEVGSGWQPAFPSAPPNVFDGTDSQATGFAFGQTIANLTGQKLTLK